MKFSICKKTKFLFFTYEKIFVFFTYFSFFSTLYREFGINFLTQTCNQTQTPTPHKFMRQRGVWVSNSPSLGSIINFLNPKLPSRQLYCTPNVKKIFGATGGNFENYTLFLRKNWEFEAISENFENFILFLRKFLVSLFSEEKFFYAPKAEILK